MFPFHALMKTKNVLKEIQYTIINITFFILAFVVVLFPFNISYRRRRGLDKL